MQHLVFVYGTLRKGESNHHYLMNSQLLGEFLTPPQYTLYDLGAYPALIEGKKSVLGEVYLIDDPILCQLDELEDVPVEYRRESLETSFGRAWIYLYQNTYNLSDEITTGDWCKRT